MQITSMIQQQQAESNSTTVVNWLIRMDDESINNNKGWNSRTTTNQLMVNMDGIAARRSAAREKQNCFIAEDNHRSKSSQSSSSIRNWASIYNNLNMVDISIGQHGNNRRRQVLTTRATWIGLDWQRSKEHHLAEQILFLHQVFWSILAVGLCLALVFCYPILHCLSELLGAEMVGTFPFHYTCILVCLLVWQGHFVIFKI